VPLHTVSHLLGHESLKMTLRYSHLATADLKRAVAALDP
jgi:site-specific recombinase XerD